MKEILLTEREMVFLVLLYFYDWTKTNFFVVEFLKRETGKSLSKILD